jgi:AAHS family 4-hydroxybenzoate transporter-like MFS transporter
MTRSIDVAAFIENRPLGWFQIRVLLVCLGVAITEGYDIQMVGYVIPFIAKDWHLGRAAFGPLFSIGIVGLLCGSLLFGLLADRYGRRKMVILCTLLYSAMTLATALATSLTPLLVLRFLTGVGVGGAIPNLIALMVEYSPRRNRSFMATFIQCGIAIGSATVGLAVAPLLPHFGWQSAFYIGGIVPLLLVPVFLLALPESVRFLVMKKRPTAVIAAALAKLDPQFRDARDVEFVAPERQRTGLPLKHLFTEGRAVLTLLLWLSFFLNTAVILSLVPWLPTLLTTIQFPAVKAAQITAMYSLGGLCGAVIFGWLIDRLGAYRVLAGAYTLGAVMIALIPAWGPSALLVSICVFGSGLCGSGGQYGGNAHAGAFYPTSMRSTGVGWALGLGRVGGAFGPLLLGGFVSMQWPLQSILIFYGVATFVAACAFGAMGLCTHPPVEAAVAETAPLQRRA